VVAAPVPALTNQEIVRLEQDSNSVIFLILTAPANRLPIIAREVALPMGRSRQLKL
jgi:hypothetical protein